MIVKGKARSGPAQLAAYLMRPEERATLIELWDGDTDLRKAFLSWHAVGEATRGDKTLYHAQIAPEAAYDMTPDQWRKAAQILAEELGMKDHPRAIVVHEGDRPHAHVVFQRADADSLKMWDDGFNYVKHERASLRMAEEFGHEIVPGKHAKRDRESQPEFPKAAYDHAEAQQAKRAGVSPKERKEQVTALFQASDSPQAFKAALAEAGYVLAKGDRRDFVIVDEHGEIHSLARQVNGIKAKDLREFMGGMENLPTAAEAKEAQRTATEALKPPAPAPAPEKVPEPTPAPPQPEIDRLEKALAAREAIEMQKLLDWHEAELKQHAHVLDIEFKEKLEGLTAVQTAERDRLQREHQQKRTGLDGFIHAVQLRLNPRLAAEQTEARKKEWEQLKARHQKERQGYIALFRQDKEMEMDALREKHAQQIREKKGDFERDRDRYLKDAAEAERLRQRLEDERRRQEMERGPEPPRRGK